ncbi:MAG: class I adenylate-forming enzyme family protein [Verrucomicrobiales bacterium]
MHALLDGWHNTLSRFRDQIALIDIVLESTWTFAQLDAAATERARAVRRSRVVFPTGNEARFVIETLAAIKLGAVICPLDAGAKPPPSTVFEEVSSPHVVTKLTSGTTGAPRLVIFTADQLIADARNIIATMGLDVRFPNIAAISLAHSYGFSNLVLPLLLHGIQMRLTGSPLPESVRRALPAQGEVTLPGVPALWRAWHTAGALDGRIRIAISAGASLSLELEHAVFQSAGVKIHNFLGSTECGGIAYDRTNEPRSDATLAGTALDNVVLQLDEEDRLTVHGAAVGSGYWPVLDNDTDILGHGSFRTSDIARLEGTSVHLLGRAGDVINVAGRKVHPAEIEASLRAHPAVGECVVFGVPSGSAGRGEEIAAYVAFSQQAATFEEVSLWLASVLPLWKIPRHWRATPSVSPNERGKIPRHEWRQKFLAL